MTIPQPKKRTRFLYLVISLLVIIVVLNLTFKIHYYKDDNYMITNLKLNDTIEVQVGQIFLGQNVKGTIEAVIFPEKYIENGLEIETDYVYMRFPPDWFIENIKPKIRKTRVNQGDNLLSDVRKVHEDNFRSYMHINKYPLIRKDYIPIVIKKKNDPGKERFSYDIKKH
jgi:hypothetical protein